MCVFGSKLYYSTLGSAKGVYEYDATSGKTVKICEVVGEAITVIDGNVWFVCTAVEYAVDYPVHSGNGDGGLYCYDGKSVTKK